jgi:hypothetical protein
VFTARYELSTYIKQITFRLQRVKLQSYFTVLRGGSIDHLERITQVGLTLQNYSASWLFKNFALGWLEERL